MVLYRCRMFLILGIGQMRADFHCVGKAPLVSGKLNKYSNKGRVLWIISFRSLSETQSIPTALDLVLAIILAIFSGITYF